VSQSTTAYLTEKCEVRNRDVAGGKAVFARELIEPGEVVAVWSGRLVSAEELDDLPDDIRRHTAQVEEGFYLASLNPDEAPDYINHSCEPNAGLDGQITIVAMVTIRPGDEITIDYAMCDGSPYDEFDCACGSSHCRGRAMPAISRPICSAASPPCKPSNPRAGGCASGPLSHSCTALTAISHNHILS